jgi:hypothetical protein
MGDRLDSQPIRAIILRIETTSAASFKRDNFR